MHLGSFASIMPIAAAAFVIGCSPGSETPSSTPDLESLHSALAERDELERTYLLTRYLRELGPEELSDALAAIETHRVGISEDEVRLFMLAWTRFDGAGAFLAARNWPTRWSKILTEQSLHAWAYNDGRAAHAEWERIEDETLKGSLREFLVGGWEQSKDLAGISEYGATVTETKLRNRLALRIAAQTMRTGPDAVIAWAESVPVDAPNDFKRIVFVHACQTLARAYPVRTADWYEKHVDQPYSRGALRKIANRWATYHEPSDLITWLENLALDDTKESERLPALGAGMRIWVSRTPAEVEAWLASNETSATKDLAIIEYARGTIDTSPAKALEWVVQIQDDIARKTATVRMAREWLISDFEGAKAWLTESDIPNSLVNKVVTNLPRKKTRGNKRKAEPDA